MNDVSGSARFGGVVGGLQGNYASDMQKLTLRLAPVCLLVVAAAIGSFPARAQTQAGGESAQFLNCVTSSQATPSGIEVRCHDAVLRIDALRDDVLRIRATAHGALAEDASWAVIPSSRESRVQVTAEGGAAGLGFHTAKLRVAVDTATAALSVSDLSGKPLLSSAQNFPVEFRGGSYRVYERMPEDEHYFGLGDKVGDLDRRDHSFSMWNTDYFHFQEHDDPIYKAIPFFLTLNSGRSIGVLLDSTWRTSFDFGQSQHDVYSFGADGGSPDIYVLYGPEPKNVVENYAWLTGTPPLPPLWTFGYQQSRFSYESETRLREIADRLRADKIPADVLYLDIDFQKDKRPFTVNTDAFPSFAKMIGDLRKQDYRVVAITDLHIAHLPSSSYAPYDSGISGDHFVKNPDGSVFVGKVWPGPSVFPDFTQKASRDWWGTLYKQFVADGVAGFWNDMNEPSVFNSELTMPGGTQHRIDEPGFASRIASHREIHNVYGMENSRATYDGLLKIEPNVRPFVLTRATYAGGQRYAATWTGDNTSSWNHLRLTTPMLLSLGLCGFGMSGADVGGFIGTPTPSLLTKWMELGTFQPIDRNHTNKGSGDKEPWVFGPEQEAIQRRYIENRYRLMPYLYTTAEELSRTGVPIVRPMFLEYPSASLLDEPLDLKAGNQFFFGHDMLVAPAPFPEQPDEYTAELPGKVWYDYWTGARVAESSYVATTNLSEVAIHPTLEVLPVFVRGGAIIPMQPLVQSTAIKPKGPLTLRVYPGPECEGSLYLDDGSSFDYRNGDSLRLNFSCTETAHGMQVKIAPRDGKFAPWWSSIELVVYGWNADSATDTIDGAPSAAAPRVDPQSHSVTLAFPDSGKGTTVDFVAPK
jgi:alpha-glucosidase